MGSPQTLVVTKKYTLQDEINEWKKRQKQLYASLNRNIQPEHLKDILGDQEYARVCTLAGGNVLTNSNLNSSSLA
jgi:riboflavin biosynthesis pyrimidine reductase